MSTKKTIQINPQLFNMKKNKTEKKRTKKEKPLVKSSSLKRELMKTEFEFQMQLKGMEQSNLSQREQDREKAKDRRVSQQSTEQSKLIEQRKNNLPPVSFESNEDSLDGFDLAEFEPR